MDTTQQSHNETSPKPDKSEKSNRGCLVAVGVGLLIIVLLWLIIRPGVFTIQPIGAIPEGITFVYHSRGSEMPFFSSPDALCIQMQGSVSLLCRASAISAASDLTDRIIIRLSYSRWAYLQSTGGIEFDE